MGDDNARNFNKVLQFYMAGADFGWYGPTSINWFPNLKIPSLNSNF